MKKGNLTKKKPSAKFFSMLFSKKSKKKTPPAKKKDPKKIIETLQTIARDKVLTAEGWRRHFLAKKRSK